MRPTESHPFPQPYRRTIYWWRSSSRNREGKIVSSDQQNLYFIRHLAPAVHYSISRHEFVDHTLVLHGVAEKIISFESAPNIGNSAFWSPDLQLSTTRAASSAKQILWRV